MLKGLRTVTALVGGFMALSSCSDVGVPTQPTPIAKTRILGGLLPVERVTPLAAPVTWSFTAGPLGASSSNSEAGLTINIPAGALSSTQTITVTALAGSAVAYNFEPHLEFSKKIRLLQDASQLQGLGLLTLWGSHFAGDAPEFVDGVLVSLEQVPAILSLVSGKVRFDVDHFSGWILASGNGGNPPDSSGGGSGQ